MVDKTSKSDGPDSGTPTNSESSTPLSALEKMHQLEPSAADEGGESKPKRRKVYEPTLLAEHKRKNVPGWVFIVFAALCLGGIVYLLVIVPRLRAKFITAGEIVVSQSPTVGGQSHLYVMKSDGTGESALTTGSGNDTQPEFAPDGNQIIFISDRDGQVNQVYVVNPDGTNRTEITRNTGSKEKPSYAPSDYETIAYTSGGVLTELNLLSHTEDILLPSSARSKNLKASSQYSSSTASIDSYAWSPGLDPSKQGLAAVEDANDQQQLVLLPTMSSDPVETSNGQPDGPPLAAAQTMSIGWSPDGSNLALAMVGIAGLPQQTKLSGLFFADRYGRQVQRPPLFAIRNDQTGPQNPVFSPDGTNIICEIWQQPDLASRVTLGIGFAALAPGSRQLIPIRGNISELKFSPDGRYIYFLNRRKDGGHDLMCADRHQGTITKISDGHSDVTGFDASPQMPKT